MATEKKQGFTKSSGQKATSPPPPLRGVLRRSSRVRERMNQKSDSACPPKLPAPAKLLENNISVSADRRSPKQVSFDEKTINSGKHTSLNNGHSQSRPLPWYMSQSELTSTEQVQYAPSITNIPSAEHTLPTSNKGMLPSSRAASIRNLMASDVVAESRQAIRSKRPHIKIRSDGDTDTSESGKRRKGNTKRPSAAVTQKLPDDPMEYTLSQLGRHPHMLSLTEISAMLQIIQNRIFGSPDGQQQGFAQKYFDFTLTPAQRDAWPFHDLRTRYIPLFMNTRYLADGSQYGWHNFFTLPQTRQHLVSSILGEWFTQRIFKHTAFGFPQHLLDILEDKDREYLRYDAVVRSKERAKLMKTWYNDWRVWPSILDNTVAAAESLAEELMTVLHPLLPPTIFDPLRIGSDQLPFGRKDSVPRIRTSQRDDLRADIKYDLINLILDCTALHKGIRLTGEDGTIVRMCPHYEKGGRFHPTAPVDCVNKQQCNQTCPQDPNEQSELCVKMTCFPRVEAVVPRGPDMQELSRHEQACRKEEAAHIAELTSNLPATLSSDDDHMDDNHIDDTATDPFTWEGKDSFWPIVPHTLQDKEGRHCGEFNVETGEINTIKRVAYVSIYPALCPAKVYCEWTPQPYRREEIQTLDDAVSHARLSHASNLKLRLEDLTIDAWNVWAIYGSYAQWGFLTTAAIVAFCRAYSIPSQIQSLLLKLSHRTGSLMRQVMPAGCSENLPRVLLERYSNLLKELYDATGPFGPAVTTPVNTLVITPLTQLYALLKGLSPNLIDNVPITTSVPSIEDLTTVAKAMTGSVGNSEPKQNEILSTAIATSLALSLTQPAAASITTSITRVDLQPGSREDTHMSDSYTEAGDVARMSRSTMESVLTGGPGRDEDGADNGNNRNERGETEKWMKVWLGRLLGAAA